MADRAEPIVPPPQLLGAAALSTIVAVALAITTVIAILAGSLAGPRAAAPDLPTELLAAPTGNAAPLISPGEPPGSVPPQ